MSYTINLTNGTIFATIPDGTINTSSSMVLVGKNYAGYGEFLDENFIHLLENSSNDTAPAAPLEGQLWWDSSNYLLKVYNGTTFKTISAATASGTPPTSNVPGDLWYDTANFLLKVWTGSDWLSVGPSVVSGTGAQPITISDGATTHNVVLISANSGNVAIFSSDAAFSPSPGISGFATIYPGLTMSSQTPGNVAVGNIINVNGNGVGNIGNASSYFNTVFAKATSAQYADVAERFAADEVLEAGTVVELGGSAEITQVTLDLSDKVFGVISTCAAYLMNSGAGTDATHPPVAMTGRVPVKTTGTVRKGDRLVSAGNGLARAAQDGEATAFNVIGRALKDKLDTGLGTVEAIVTIK